MAQGTREYTDRAAAQGAQIDRLVVRALHLERDVVQVTARDFHHLARSQHDVAAVAGDHRVAVHANVGGNQVDIAVARTDAALGLDGAGCALALELELARLEVGIVHVQGGRHETLGVNDAARAKYHAIRVHQEHPAVGAERAINLALEVGVLCLYAVEYGAGRILLLEVSGLPGADVEALPVDDRARCVGHRQARTLGLHGGLAVHYLRPRGIGLYQLRPETVNSGQRNHQSAATETWHFDHQILLTSERVILLRPATWLAQPSPTNRFKPTKASGQTDTDLRTGA